MVNILLLSVFADRFACPYFFVFRDKILKNFYGGASVISKQEMKINEEIRAAQVRLVGPEGEQLGIMDSASALDLAYQKNLDLVLIAPKAEPPVCKVMDYGKYKFELAKRDKEAKKNQKTMNVKEIRISPSIDDHDFDTKANHAKKFLQDGDKVKVSIRFRGREIHHSALGTKIMERFRDALSEYGTADKPPKLEGRSMNLIISPVTKKD